MDVYLVDDTGGRRVERTPAKLTDKELEYLISLMPPMWDSKQPEQVKQLKHKLYMMVAELEAENA